MAVPAEQVEVVRSAAPAAARAPKVKMVKKKDLSPELLSLGQDINVLEKELYINFIILAS